ncbi:MAG TPA: alkaline phosphatase family protein [Candidatus Aminicenantes bacterium]|nr:alkaline phosphatase family protein [Candidatus Aminicenantes bacterium]HRY65316.1 alkaline phosphatase family protein [Candidatus Aminicenantes bacterium]HRZ72216.1 alkaline phosphatase family protein [Candidatus Aminicenantes bacterium]
MSGRGNGALTRRQFLKAGVAATAAAGLGGAVRLGPKAYGYGPAPKKMIILGIDGLDPVLTQRWIDEGRMPAFRRLLEAGGDFRPLGTSLPPQSPVAWSNFITGMDPGGHGIFDFIHRDPGSYVPIFSATETTGASRTVRLGKTIIPLSGGRVRNLRRGQAFWQLLEKADVPATVFKMPSNYPPVESRQRTLSGMNTPDIKGSYGIFNYYTNAAASVIQEAGGGGRVHDVFVVGNRVEAELPGPTNTFRTDAPEAAVPFQVFIDPSGPAAKIVIQGREFVLKEREWSGWVHVHFDLIPTQSVHGLCLFYLKEVRPKFKLYISPVNIDPARPALPISTPASYARELERRFGPFFTKGLPADTSALENGVLDEEEFLHLDAQVYEESLAMLEYELGRFDEGLLFYYFSDADQRQHMFWRLTDPLHPAYDEKLAARYGGVIARTYEEMDRALDMALRRADRDTVVLVLSDHGFNSFRRGLNLNTWLLREGYHRLKRPWKQEESSLFDNTDWSKTRAYGVGLNSLYINERGREAEGLVAPGADKDNLVREIAAKLEALVDPRTGEHPVLKAFVSREAYRGRHLKNAPDIVLGFNQGYRISWQSPLGGFPREILEDNTQKWSGDHMAAPQVLPGVAFANRKFTAGAPALYDLTASVLGVFGVQPPPEMIGRDVLAKS